MLESLTAIVKVVLRGINSMTTYKSRNIAIVKRIVMGLGILLLAAGCSPSPEGDGGASGSVSGLEMTTTMSVVAPTGGFNASPSPMKTINLSISDLKSIVGKAISGQIFDPESDFEKDKTSTTVAEDSNESLEFVNLLLCFIDQTRMADLVNTGAYTAFLNPTECIPGLEDVGFFRAIVESKRAFENSPHYVNIWVPFADFLGSDWGGGLVLETVIYAEASTANPIGQFELKMSLNVIPPTGESFEIPPLIMNTRTVQRNDGKIEFISFVESGDPFLQEFDKYSLGSANVVMDDAQGNGGASVSFSRDLEVRCDDGPPSYNPINPCVIDTTQNGYEVVYNLTHLYRRDTGLLSPTPVEACFDRTNPFYEADDYGIYYEQDGIVNGTTVTAGQRVATNKRFGFEYLGQVGWADSYGIDWYSGDNTVLLPDGATITSTGLVNQNYVVHRSEGDLSRYIGRNVAVASIPGAVFSYWGNYSGSPASILTWDGAGRYPSDFGFVQWRVAINPATLNFEITGGMVQDPVSNDDVLSSVTVPAAIINQPVNAAGAPFVSPLRLTAYRTSMEYDDSLYASPAVGNLTYRGRYEGILPWHSDLYTAATQTGSTTTLYCYNNCMIGGIFAPLPATVLTYAGFNTAAPSAGSIAAAVDIPVVTEGGLRTYDLITDGKKYRLIDNTNMLEVALLDTSAVMFTSRSMNGLRDAQFPPISMIHPTLNPGGTINATSLPELKLGEAEFNWDTGTRDYNKVYTASKNTASDPVETFNELIQFLYKHDIADDINDALNFPQVESWDNLLTVFDTYGRDLNASVPRFDWPYTSSQNWGVNAVNITKGVVLTDFDGINYVVKPLRIEQFLIEYEVTPGVPDTAPCLAVLDQNRAKNELQLPTSDSVNPMIIDFSDRPISISTPPKVIDGEIL